MLACDASPIPAVLGGHGQPVDVGREWRLYTGAPRTALEIRDGGCVWPGCARPVSWCQIHHLIPWSEGGRTDQANGGLFCWHHHRDIGAGEWDRFYYRGRIWLRPPARLDSNRRPRINPPTDHHHPEPTGHPPPTLAPGHNPLRLSANRQPRTATRHRGRHVVEPTVTMRGRLSGPGSSSHSKASAGWQPRTVLFRELEPAGNVDLARAPSTRHAAHAVMARQVVPDDGSRSGSDLVDATLFVVARAGRVRAED